MKKLILIAFYCLTLQATGQSDKYLQQFDTGYSYDRFDWVNLKSKRDARQHGIMAGLMFTSGMARGMEQVLAYHYDYFEKRHPRANPNYWNPKYSWTNKYKHNNPQAGSKFLFSTTALVWLTDGKHLMDMLNNVPVYVCITIPIAYPTYKYHNWHDIIGRAVMLSIWRQAGFYTTYNVLY